jgi:hypothetical protein
MRYLGNQVEKYFKRERLKLGTVVPGTQEAEAEGWQV